MNIVFLNTYCHGSTGSVISEISKECEKRGDHVLKIYGRCKSKNKDWIYCGENWFINKINNLFVYLTGLVGHFHILNTIRIIKIIRHFKPNLINIHNIHGNYINLKIFLTFCANNNLRLVITMHDQFWLTGRCALIKKDCLKWKSSCFKCRYKSKYPHCFIDASRFLFNEKKRLISLQKNISFVSPSIWQYNLFNESYLKKFSCKVIRNAFSFNDLFFKKNELACIDPYKINLFFAANPWSYDKGIKVINDLCVICDRNKFNLIVAGVSKKDKKKFDKRLNLLPVLDRKHIVSYMKYSDFFVFPSMAENLPTVLIESLYANTPSIVFNVGGNNEIIDDTVGAVLNDQTAYAILNAIEKHRHFNKKDFESKLLLFDAKSFAKKYFDVFNE